MFTKGKEVATGLNISVAVNTYQQSHFATENSGVAASGCGIGCGSVVYEACWCRVIGDIVAVSLWLSWGCTAHQAGTMV